MADRIIKEDDNIELDVSMMGDSIEELHDELGSELFSDENIPFLKEAGLINERGYPVGMAESFSGDLHPYEMDLFELSALDSDFIKNRYIRELLVTELKEHLTFDENGDAVVTYHEDDLPQIGHMDDKFLTACFEGDVFEYFIGTWDNLSFKECGWYVDDVPQEVKDELESHGFPPDIYELLKDGSEDEESELAKYYDDLKDALVNAVALGYESGSAAQAVNDFDDSFNDAIPEGCHVSQDYSTQAMRRIKVPMSFIESHIDDIWGSLGSYDDDLTSSFLGWFLDDINDYLSGDFHEPYYGWSEFDSDAFADELLNNIMNLDLPDMVDLSDNGGQSGTNEDLDLDVIDGKAIHVNNVSVRPGWNRFEIVDQGTKERIIDDIGQNSRSWREMVSKYLNEPFVWDILVLFSKSDGKPLDGYINIWEDGSRKTRVLGHYEDGPRPSHEIVADIVGSRVDEDVDLDVLDYGPKDEPKRIYYRYRELNDELSSKSYYLDEVRYRMLIDFLSKGDGKELLVPGGMDMLASCEESPEDVILSKIVPSPANGYAMDSDGYALWVASGGYGTDYVGWIPERAAEDILGDDGIREDLELEVVPVPDVEVGPLWRLKQDPSVYRFSFTSDERFNEDMIKDLIANRYASPTWVVQERFGIYSIFSNNFTSRTKNFDNLADAYEAFKSTEMSRNGEVWLMYVPEPNDKGEWFSEAYYVPVAVKTRFRE